MNKLTASSRNSKSSGKQLGADICTFAPGEKISREDGGRSATETSLLQCIRLVDQSAKKIKDGELGTIYKLSPQKFVNFGPPSLQAAFGDRSFTQSPYMQHDFFRTNPSPSLRTSFIDGSWWEMEEQNREHLFLQRLLFQTKFIPQITEFWEHGDPWCWHPNRPFLFQFPRPEEDRAEEEPFTRITLPAFQSPSLLCIPRVAAAAKARR